MGRQSGKKNPTKNQSNECGPSLECLEMASGNLEVTPRELGRVSYAKVTFEDEKWCLVEIVQE